MPLGSGIERQPNFIAHTSGFTCDRQFHVPSGIISPGSPPQRNSPPKETEIGRVVVHGVQVESRLWSGFANFDQAAQVRELEIFTDTELELNLSVGCW